MVCRDTERHSFDRLGFRGFLQLVRLHWAEQEIKRAFRAAVQTDVPNKWSSVHLARSICAFVCFCLQSQYALD